MPNWYKATCLKEIYWQGQTYRQGDSIKVLESDARILTDAGAIGGTSKITVIETATKKAPENAMKTSYRKR
jgi:hypothetical protein